MLSELTCTIDGHEVPIRDLTANCALGGYDQFRAETTEEKARQLPSSITQGATVKLWTQGGTCIWEGRLALDPHITNGVARLSASGHKTRLEKEDDPLFFQSRDPKLFEDAGGPPLSLTTKEDIEADVRRQLLWWRITQEQSYSADQGHWLSVYKPRSTITRYAGDLTVDRTTSDFDVRTRRFSGPSGATNNVSTHALTALTLSVDVTIGTPQDGFAIGVRANTSTTPANPRVVKWQNLRINGIAPDDTYAVYEAMQHMAGALSFDDSGISTGLSLNCLPLDWTDSWASLFDYLAMLQDGWWRVLDNRGDGPYVEANTWGNGTAWTCSQAEGAVLDLGPQEKFNVVQVNYLSINGAPRTVRATASPDPLADVGITNVYEEELEDRQADSTLAELVRDALLEVVPNASYTGRISATVLRDEAGRDAPHEAKAGDTVTVTDWNMGESFTHRIHDVEYRTDGVTLGIEGPVNPVSPLLEVAGLKQARRRHPVRKRKGRRNRK